MKPELQKVLDDVAELIASAKAEALAARNDALEEAARMVSQSEMFCYDEKELQRQLVAAIRALKDHHNNR